MNRKKVIFDHLTLSKSDRELIKQACNNSYRVFLAPLDKGLSGSKVYLARWKINSKLTSKYHVFKIGTFDKLQREENAIKHVASVVQQNFANADLFKHPSSDAALLRQQFEGGDLGEGRSLRLFINESRELEDVRKIIDDLYNSKLQAWNNVIEIDGDDDDDDDDETEFVKIKDALDWWLSKEDIEKAAIEIGRKQLEESIRKHFNINLADIKKSIDKIKEKEIRDEFGAVHGDLHSQNVIIDRNKEIHLIDFGWTGIKWRLIDFIMMECSLKFLVAPPNSPLMDLLKLEDLLDENWGVEDFSVFNELEERLLGFELLKIAYAIHQIRLCAIKLKIVDTIHDYKDGLIPLIAGLASIPSKINRVFLFHSLAYHINKES